MKAPSAVSVTLRVEISTGEEEVIYAGYVDVKIASKDCFKRMSSNANRLSDRRLRSELLHFGSSE